MYFTIINFEPVWFFQQNHGSDTTVGFQAAENTGNTESSNIKMAIERIKSNKNYQE